MSSSLVATAPIDTLDRFSNIAADGITKKPEQVSLNQYHLNKMGLYKEQAQWTPSVPFDAYVEALEGFLVEASLYQGKKEKTRLALSFLTSKTTGFQINLLADANQWHYRTALGVLQAVNLSDRAVTVSAVNGRGVEVANEKGDVETRIPTFINVHVDGIQVRAKAIDRGLPALVDGVNDIREQLGLQPQYPEWLSLRTTDYSQTPSVPVSSETCSDEPESSSQSQI
jgi:hypothetical protein